MKKQTLANLSKKAISIHPISLPIFNIFNSHISPHLSNEDRELQFLFEISRPTLFVKQEHNLQQLNNFEIFRRLKSYDNELIAQEVYYVLIEKEEYPINQCLFELFQTVSLNYRELDLRVIYQALKSILDDNDNPLKISDKCFSKETFSQMIGISVETLHRRISSQVSNKEE